MCPAALLPRAPLLLRALDYRRCPRIKLEDLQLEGGWPALRLGLATRVHGQPLRPPPPLEQAVGGPLPPSIWYGARVRSHAPGPAQRRGRPGRPGPAHMALSLSLSLMLAKSASQPCPPARRQAPATTTRAGAPVA